LQEQLNSESGDSSLSDEEIQEIESQITSLQGELNSINGELEEKANAEKIALEALNNAIKALEDATNALTNANADKESAIGDVESSEQALEEAKKTLEEANKTLEEANGVFEDAKADYDNKQDVANKAQEEANGHKAVAEEARANADAARAEADRLKKISDEKQAIADKAYEDAKNSQATIIAPGNVTLNSGGSIGTQDHSISTDVEGGLSLNAGEGDNDFVHVSAKNDMLIDNVTGGEDVRLTGLNNILVTKDTPPIKADKVTLETLEGSVGTDKLPVKISTDKLYGLAMGGDANILNDKDLVELDFYTDGKFNYKKTSYVTPSWPNGSFDDSDEDQDGDSDEDQDGDSDEDQDGDSDEDQDGDSDEDQDGDSDEDQDGDSDEDQDGSSENDVDEDSYNDGTHKDEVIGDKDLSNKNDNLSTNAGLSSKDKLIDKDSNNKLNSNYYEFGNMSDSPKTGDSLDFMLFFLMMLISLLGLGLLITNKKKIIK